LADIPKAEISVLCTIDSQTLEETVYNFMLADVNEKAILRGHVLDAFEKAERLCAYNSVLFDIPFMAKQLDIPSNITNAWLLKLCDPFHSMKTSFDFTCKLDKLLALNSLQCKSASGLQAIEMARNGEWDDLVSYCMDDVRLTAQLCELPVIYLFKHLGESFFCDIWQDSLGFTPCMMFVQMVFGSVARFNTATSVFLRPEQTQKASTKKRLPTHKLSNHACARLYLAN
jgi:hypothetical protein